MALRDDIANKSIREAIGALADAVDAKSPTSNVELIKAQADIQELKSQITELKQEIDGAPAPAPLPEVPPAL